MSQQVLTVHTARGREGGAPHHTDRGTVVWRALVISAVQVTIRTHHEPTDSQSIGIVSRDAVAGPHAALPRRTVASRARGGGFEAVQDADGARRERCARPRRRGAVAVGEVL